MAPISKIISLEVILSAAAIGIVSALVMCVYQRRKKLKPPTTWEPVGVVKNLYIYPFKSGTPIELQTVLCTAFGVKTPDVPNLHQFRDRSFVVYNKNDLTFQTARTIPKLVLIKIEAVDENHIKLSAPNMPILTIEVPNRIKNKVVTIRQHFNEKIPTIDCGDEAAKWISRYASDQKMELGIAFHDAKQRRNLNNTHQKYFGIYPTLTNGATGLHSDFTSYLLVSESSVNDLKDRAPEANIVPLNFRPNILIEGAPPFAEDEWQWVKIGDVVLYFVKWCTRCVLTTVNPTTGIKSEQNEPLKTLRTYRMLKDVKKISLDGTSPLMGINMAYHSGEKINVGDVVYVGK